MRYFSFDDDGYFLGSGEATPGDVPGSWIYPPSSTSVEPPPMPDSMLAKWDGNAWEIVAGRTPEELARRADAILLPLIMRDMAETASLSDAQLVSVGAAGYFDSWAAGASYLVGKRLVHDGVVYVVEQPIAAQAHQPPGAEGMLAIYRPVRPAGEDESDGSLGYPFDLVIGMKGEAGKYYRHAGEVWECLREMANILEGWLPGATGMESFWRKVAVASAAATMFTAASAPAPAIVVSDVATLRYYLTGAGTYHREGCPSTSAAGEWLAFDEIAARNPSARPCRRCSPPALEGGTDA